MAFRLWVVLWLPRCVCQPCPHISGIYMTDMVVRAVALAVYLRLWVKDVRPAQCSSLPFSVSLIGLENDIIDLVFLFYFPCYAHRLMVAYAVNWSTSNLYNVRVRGRHSSQWNGKPHGTAPASRTIITDNHHGQSLGYRIVGRHISEVGDR